MRTDLQTWISESVKKLKGISDFPLLECHALLAHTLSKPREWIISHPEAEITPEQMMLLDSQFQRLLNGTPLPYITGTQAFYGLDFIVSPDVLIPRPETELLVEEAIEWLSQHSGCRTALDMGTGSGVIAVTLADQVPDLQVTASDISPAALEVARQNAQKFKVSERITFVESDLFEKIGASFDLIAANLPYIPSMKLGALAVSKFEPQLALNGGLDGLDLIRKFIVQAVQFIRPGGLILMEIESGQGDSALVLAQNTIAEGSIRLVMDYAGLPRLVVIQAM